MSVAALTVGLLTAGIALAQNPRVNSARVDEDRVIVKFTGLGGLEDEEDVSIIMDVDGTVTVDCRNPGGNVVEAQGVIDEPVDQEVDTGEIDRKGQLTETFILEPNICKSGWAEENVRIEPGTILTFTVQVGEGPDAVFLDAGSCEVQANGRCT